jgi:ATP-binding cassette subfamily B protein
MAILRRILTFWKPHRRVGAGLIVTMLLQALFTVVVALSIKLIIDAVVGGDGDNSPFFVIALLSGGFVAAAAAGIANGYLAAQAGADILADVRMALFDQLQRLSIGFHRRSQVGDLISHFSTDVAQLSGGVIKMPLRGLKSTLAILFYLPVMFVLEPRLAIAAAGAAPLAVYLVNRYSPDADSALDQEKQEIALVLNEVSENLRAQTAIRAFGLRRRARDRFRQRISSLHASSSIADFRVQLAAALSEYSVALAQVAIVALGAILALGGSLEPGTLAAFVALLVEFAWEATVIGRDVLPEVRKAWSGIRRIDALLANPAPTSSGEGNVTPALDDSVRFEKVSFGYSTGGDSLQLEDVNLSFDAGSYVAVVGASGSGKSTLLSLLLRFYDPTAGQILIDSVPLTELDAEGLRALTGVVFQETFLFNASLRDNIVLAENSVTDFDLELVLESTGLAEVVRNLPEGLDTIIGAGGRQLSGGQAQRVGLARALLRNPRLLLLDEATSALDPSTEAAVVETIGRIRHGRTVVMVTHRLETVVDADLIVVMRNGQVDEVGQFEDLLESGRTFAEMWSKQRGFVVGRDGRSASVTADRLAAIPLFSVLSEESLNQIAGDFVAQQHAAETVIFEEGDLGDRFFVIVRGVVEVSKSSGDGEKVVAHLEDGDFFGEMALLDAATRNATVVAVTPTTTLSLDRDQFRAMIEGTPEMAVAVQAVADARSTENGTS